jgi:hypothetical protein
MSSSTPVVPRFTRAWDLRLAVFLLFVIAMSFVIPLWHTSYWRDRYWNWWTFTILLCVGIVLSYSISLNANWHKVRLPRNARVAVALVVVVLVAVNAWRIRDLIIKINWFNAQSQYQTGAP